MDFQQNPSKMIEFIIRALLSELLQKRHIIQWNKR